MVAKALFCRRYPTNRGTAVEITGFHPKERWKEPMKSRYVSLFIASGTSLALLVTLAEILWNLNGGVQKKRLAIPRAPLASFDIVKCM